MTGTRRLAGLILLGLCASSGADEGLRERLKDANGVRSDVWVYNDIGQALAEARRLNKPVFVTFRCVPCKDCAAFDADVANGNERVQELAREKFVSVRQVEMKGVDLSQFQFDYDLNWAGMFLNADGTVYARYGTQSAEGSDAYNSIEGLLKTMNRVLELHAAYPDNREELAAKRGEPKPVSNALDLPGMRNRERYAKQTQRDNCIHCHNIHDAEHFQALKTGTWNVEQMWKYPLPDNLGLKIDRADGVRISDVVDGSAADVAGLTAGDNVVRMNGQRITSIADMQWVLHHLPKENTQLEVETSGAGKRTIALKDGWKKSDFSWRGSMWNAPPRLQIWMPPVDAETRAKLELTDAGTALEVRWINREGPGGEQAFQDGLREKDVIVALDGKPFDMDTREFQMHVKLNYQVGDVLPLTVVRNGKRLEIGLKLVE